MHPMEHKTLPPPYYNQENKDLPRGRKKKWVPYLSPLVANTGPLNQTQTLRSGRTTLQRKERGKCPQKGLGLAQPPSLARQLCNHLQLLPKFQKHLRIGPHP